MRTSMAAPAKAKGVARTDFLASRTAEFAQMDSNRDNAITELEIVTYRVKKAEAEALAQNRSVFAALDADKNGYLSPAEFAVLVKSPPLPDVKPFITALDSDRNGSLSATEYRSGMAAQFDKMDRNHDGLIDQGELASRPARPTPIMGR